MKVTRIRLLNYKGFSDSGWIDLGENFTVVVGRNNSGKTSLLEGFRLQGISPHPHRDLKTRPEELSDPHSYVQIEIVPEGHEIIDAMRARGGDLHIPLPGSDDARDDSIIAEFFAASGVRFQLQAASHGGIQSLIYPSHSLFDAVDIKRAVHLSISAGKTDPVQHARGANGNDSSFEIFNGHLQRRIYVFKAERLNIGRSGFNTESNLSDDASNLPQVLFSMSTNLSLFERFNAHVNEIFPTIQRVAIASVGQELEVRLWNVDPKTERDDLAISLLNSGTGVAQVLAILYVAMTMRGSVIVIDEPNSFLHPGASKKLISILKQYSHQYIISTHSTEIISAADPDALITVKWRDGESIVEAASRGELSAYRSLMSELGVAASDWFGADAVLWVEGPTEEECFPLIIQHQLGRMPSGLLVNAVRSVDEALKGTDKGRLVVDIYKRLSANSALLPSEAGFVFDRENRDDAYCEKVFSETDGAVHFIGRRTYENYLLVPSAVAEAVNEIRRSVGEPTISDEDVVSSIGRLAAESGWKGRDGDPLGDERWLRTADAPRLLDGLFHELAHSEYRKTRHSVAITRWLLEHNPQALAEVKDTLLLALGTGSQT